MRKYIKVFITIFIHITVFMGLLEVTVRVGFLPDLTRLPQPKVVPDPYLGHRFEPNQPELDSNGWRNVRVPEQSDVEGTLLALRRWDRQHDGKRRRSMLGPLLLNNILVCSWS